MSSPLFNSLVVALVVTQALAAQEPAVDVPNVIVPEIEFSGPANLNVLTIRPDGQLVVVEDPFSEPLTLPQPVIAPAIPVPAATSTLRRTGSQRISQPLPQGYVARDKNGDGQIGLYEWDRAKYAEFAKLDRNGDGFLTAQELGAKSTAVQSRLRLGPDKPALPNPGNLTAYNSKIGETFTFTVTGQASGSIWGTGTYTTDSSLATAAVHSGVLKDGETGNVRVSIIQSPSQFMASTANGVTSSPWQAFSAAYTVSR